MPALNGGLDPDAGQPTADATSQCEPSRAPKKTRTWLSAVRDPELQIRPYWRWFTFMADCTLASDRARGSMETTTYWRSFLSPAASRKNLPSSIR